MNAPAEQNKTRLERAAEAWEAAEHERAGGPPPDLDRLKREFGDEMGAKLHELASQPPRRSLESEMEYLRLWLVYQAARQHPLLEALSTFEVQKEFRPGSGRVEWEMHCDTVFPGHRHPGDNLRWHAAWRLDPYVTRMCGDWTEFARIVLGNWLRQIETNLAEAAIGAPG